MRKEYGKVLREVFTKAMQEELPQFDPVSLKEPPYRGEIYIWPGDRVFLWNPSGSIHCYIVLMASPQYDEFYVFIGWSRLGRFPHRDRAVTDITPEREEFEEDEFIAKASRLCGKGGGWSVSVMTVLDDSGILPDFDELMDSQLKLISVENAKKMILPLVDEAIGCLVMHGVPYLEEFVEFATKSDKV